jgi:hypothetical protein
VTDSSLGQPARASLTRSSTAEALYRCLPPPTPTRALLGARVLVYAVDQPRRTVELVVMI